MRLSGRDGAWPSKIDAPPPSSTQMLVSSIDTSSPTYCFMAALLEFAIPEAERTRTS